MPQVRRILPEPPPGTQTKSIPEFTLHDFNKIASGEYNAGQIDFRHEADNVEEGVELYDVRGTDNHPMRAIAPTPATSSGS